MQDGITEWSASISSASFGLENDIAQLSNVHFFFNSQEIEIDADRGSYDLLQNNLTLQGNVKATTKSIVMHIDSISWSSLRGDLLSDSPVLIEGGTFSVRGRGLYINKNGDVRIKEDTKALITF